MSVICVYQILTLTQVNYYDTHDDTAVILVVIVSNN